VAVVAEEAHGSFARIKIEAARPVVQWRS
jgi:hypothetical protein